MNEPIKILKPSIQSLYLLFLNDERPLYSGTGIVIMSDFGPLLVTTRRLITGRNPRTNRALSTSKLVPDTVKIAQNRNRDIGEYEIKQEALYTAQRLPRWIEHPKLRARANIAALPLEDVSNVDFYPYDLEHPGPDVAIGLTDAVSIIGYPYPPRGEVSFPVWSNGYIASEPQLNHFDLPVFLIDYRSRSGQSGAAVVAHRNDGCVVGKGGSYQDFGGPATKFLGIYGGRLSVKSDLGMVWRVSALRELIGALRKPLGYSEDTSEVSKSGAIGS